MAGEIVSVAEVIGKDLFSKSTVIGYNLPNTTSTKLYSFKPNTNIGRVRSYIQRPGQIFWQFYDNNNSPFYVLHEQGKFDLKALKEQGTKTEAEKKEEEKTLTDKILEIVEKYGKYALIVYVGFEFFKEYNRNKK